MSLDIHLGVRREDTLAFQRLLTRELDNHTVKSKDDNWHTWEPFDAKELAEEEMQQEIVHLYIETLTPMVTLNFLVSRLGIFLNAINDEKSAFFGRMLIVTDHDNWTQYYVELSYPDY